MAWGSRREMLAAGAAAPSFRLKALDGGAVTGEDLLSAGPVLLAFFKSSCPVCQFTLPFLNRLAGRGGLRVFAVSQDEERTTRGFLEEFGIGYPALLDDARANYPASNAFRISSVPSLFLIEPDGRIAWASSGFSRRDLEDLAGGRLDSPLFAREESVPEWRAG